MLGSVPPPSQRAAVGPAGPAATLTMPVPLKKVSFTCSAPLPVAPHVPLTWGSPARKRLPTVSETPVLILTFAPAATVRMTVSGSDVPLRSSSVPPLTRMRFVALKPPVSATARVPAFTTMLPVVVEITFVKVSVPEPFLTRVTAPANAAGNTVVAPWFNVSVAGNALVTAR